MGLFSSITKGIFGNRGAKKERQKVNAMMDTNIGLYNNAMADTKEAYQPYTDFGKQSVNSLMDPGKSFQADPGYGFVRGEGTRDIGSTFAAKGGALSGNALKALTEYNSGLASQEYGNWWDRQFRGAALGSQATGQVTDFLGNTTDSIAQANAIKGGMSAQEAAVKNANLGKMVNTGLGTLFKKYGF